MVLRNWSEVKRMTHRMIGFISLLVMLSAIPVATSLTAFGVADSTVSTMLLFLFVALVYLAFLSPWLPLESNRSLTRSQKLEATVYYWFAVQCSLAIVWEAPWVLFHDAIVAAADQAWTYPWRFYFEGGDSRYAAGTARELLGEAMAVGYAVGTIGILWWRRRTGRLPLLALLFLMGISFDLAIGVFEYFSVEAMSGLAHVGPDFWIDFVGKFILVNSPWMVMPCFVIAWGVGILRAHSWPATAKPLQP